MRSAPFVLVELQVIGVSGKGLEELGRGNANSLRDTQRGRKRQIEGQIDRQGKGRQRAGSELDKRDRQAEAGSKLTTRSQKLGGCSRLLLT